MEDRVHKFTECSYSGCRASIITSWHQLMIEPGVHIIEPIVTVMTRPDRCALLTHDRLFAQSAVITADSTGESGVAGREQWPVRKEGVVITRKWLS